MSQGNNFWRRLLYGSRPLEEVSQTQDQMLLKHLSGVVVQRIEIFKITPLVVNTVLDGVTLLIDRLTLLEQGVLGIEVS